MNILIVGVSGFIGHHLYNALTQQGHHVIGSSRNKVPNIHWQKLDFKQSINDWKQQLQSIDLVINAAGIFQQTKTQKFSDVHDDGPKKLFAACNQLLIKVIQISAIGAEQEHPVTEFLQSKRNADQALLESKQANIVIYPGIVLGESGKSTRQLSMLARLIFIPLVFGKNRELPLISIYQLTEYIIKTINNWPKSKTTKLLIAHPETMQNLFNNLRKWMHLNKGHFLLIPNSLIKFTFFLLPKLSIGTFNKQSLDMLAAYSNNEISTTIKQTASDSLLTNGATQNFNKSIQLNILLYLNIFILSVIWVVSGLSSIINMEQSRELISMTGISGLTGDSIIVSAAIMDIILGLLLFFTQLRRKALILQLFIIVIYSLIISIFIPQFWLHPFAPIVKNLAMVVLAFYILIEEKE